MAGTAIYLRVLAVGALCLVQSPALPHPGGLNAEGCHTNHKTGDYHCHRGGDSTPDTTPKSSRQPPVYFRNCSEARQAGAAPIRRGQPGYGAHLDRDNDGIACE